MDTQVNNAIVLNRDIGNFPAELVTYYTTDKPTLVLTDKQHASYYYFKTDKKAKTRRESFAVIMPNVDADEFGSVKGHEMLNGLIRDFQENLGTEVANGEMSYDVLGDWEKLVTAYFDTTRKERKVSKETIATYYMDKFAPVIVARALAKNAQMTDDTVKNVVKGYMEMFQKFTGYSLLNVFTPAQVELLKQVITQAESTNEDAENDEMLSYFKDKIAKIIAARTEQDNLADMI